MFSTKAVLYRLLARKLYTFKYALHRSLNIQHTQLRKSNNFKMNRKNIIGQRRLFRFQQKREAL